MGKIILGVVLLLVVALAIGGCGTYNGLVKKSQEVDSQWGNVEAAYQRRMDLIPNLVSTVKGEANFEKSTLTQIAEARASVGSIKITPGQAPATAEELQKFEQAQGALSQALSRLLSVTENYPTLRATEAFRDLQTQLEGTENRINTERTHFNDVVKVYNSSAESFPGVIVARLGGFMPKAFFQADRGAEKAPTVDFGAGGAGK
jgi:LemA protein